MLGLFQTGLLPVHADFGITLAVGNSGHGQVHANLSALAFKVGLQGGDDLCLDFLGHVSAKLLAYTDNMLGSPDHVSLLLGELGAGDLALGAELGGSISLMNVTAYGANPFLHCNFLLIL